MQFKTAIFCLTIDDIRASDMMHYEAILCFTERDIILQSTRLMPAIEFFAERYETERISYLQANAIVGSVKPHNGEKYIAITEYIALFTIVMELQNKTMNSQSN